jgi:UDPglucose 6-dehydrogenase
MRISVIGTGYVGLVTASCLAEMGNTVLAMDKDPTKITSLRRGVVPIHEPGLEPLVQKNVREERLSFTDELPTAVRHGQVIFLAVGTPPRRDGEADLGGVEEAARGIGLHMDAPKVIVTKSTVPVGTAGRVEMLINEQARHPFAVVSNPEFLKEGAAVEDFMRPDRVILGGSDPEAISLLRALYAPFMRRADRVLVMDAASAELSKYAANAMLASRISFMNEMAALCERLGANVEHVRQGLGSDSRIGNAFLFPGIGFGGSCFPKDLNALLHVGESCGVDLRMVRAALDVNRSQKRLLLHKIRADFGEYLDGRVFALWGLAFKPGTDDVREAPAIDLIDGLLSRGAEVRATDPAALERVRTIYGERVTLDQDPYRILMGADALVLATEWNEYRFPDFDRIRAALRKALLFDGRNVWKRTMVEALGFAYRGVGV